MLKGSNAFKKHPLKGEAWCMDKVLQAAGVLHNGSRGPPVNGKTKATIWQEVLEKEGSTPFQGKQSVWAKGLV